MQGHALAARRDRRRVAAAQRDRLDLVVGDDDQPRSVVLVAAYYFQVGDGRLRLEHLDLLDDDGRDAAHRVVRLRVDHANHFARVRPDDQNVVRFPVRRTHLRVHRQLREFVPKRTEIVNFQLRFHLLS